MGAFFYDTQAGGIFKNQVSDGSIISIDFLDSVVNNTTNLVMYNNVSVGTSEIIQYFLTFDDVIKYLHFGKGLGTVNVNGIVFSDCAYNMPGINALYNAFSKVRGQTVKVSLGSYAASAVVVSTNVDVLSDPDTMAQFSVSMNIISDNSNTT